jgi:hypothetical protein
VGLPCGKEILDFIYEYNFLPQGIKIEQFFARSFHLKKYLKLFLFWVNSKTSKSKADESQILNEVQN